jgi:glutathione synthase/RimK-type ligase-like ATP-grasp enzyme
MILLAGIRTETPLAMVADALTSLGSEFRFVHQRDVASHSMKWAIDGQGVTGSLNLGDDVIDLSAVTSVYMRLMDDSRLPELRGLAAGDPLKRHARGFHDAFYRWSEVTPARVVNRADMQASNGSKPFQAQIIAAAGLLVPPTLITSNAEAVLEFRARHGRIIYKSISGLRSVVRQFEDKDIDRLDRLKWCPVQFQAELEGSNIRVHVIGAKTFATFIESTHVDYRYAHLQGGNAKLSAIELHPDISGKCVILTHDLGLEFAGIDLFQTKEGEYYCFEVNPQPAFSYFELNSRQPIAAAVAAHLAAAA